MHRIENRAKAFFASLAIVLAPLALVASATGAQAAPVYQDSSVSILHGGADQSVDAITSIDAPANWGVPSTATTCNTTPTNLGSAFTVVPVPSVMCVAFEAHGTNLGPLSWSIVPGSEVNIPAGVVIGINPTSGKLTVTPPGGPVIPANNQDISLKVEVTDGTATAFETLNAKPIIVSGLIACGEDTNSCINAIDVTAVTDAVTVLGANDNVTGFVNFASIPAGAALSAANLPPGVVLSGVHLTGTNAIPDNYSGLRVTATDAAGATAVDTFNVEVDGAKVRPNLPYLYGGHATAGINSSRENVFVVLGGQDSCLHFEIVGPGAINGHQGWVPGHLGLNEGVYGGLLAHHGYTVYYQPVTQNADGSPTGNSSCTGGPTIPVAGTHWGYVYFIAGK
jgi:hypothetical protein